VIGIPCALKPTTVSAGISLTVTAVTGIKAAVSDLVQATILDEIITINTID